MNNAELRRQIRDIRKSTGLGWGIIEQDYILSWVLFGISKMDKLKSTLVFKGGTALKKCYFGNYRFSQDLDFSVHGEYPRGKELFDLIVESCHLAAKNLDNIEFQCKKYPEQEPHPEEQEAFVIHAKLPWQRDFMTSVKVEVTTREILLLDPIEKTIIHSYAEKLSGTIFTYRLEEIIAEKVRAILQFSKKLHERGWGRSRVRDYYDLWRIFGEYEKQIDKSILPALVMKKCEIKSIDFKSIDDLFEERLMIHLNDWEHWLSPVLPLIPDKNKVVNELKLKLNEVFV